MIERNTQTSETHVFCDRCQKELTDRVYALTTGDVLCEECFDDSYRIKSADDYIKEVYG